VSGDSDSHLARFSVPDELQDVATRIKEQSRDDYWSLADLALIELLLGKNAAASAYAAFDAQKPPDFAYKSGGTKRY
jgi:hypothetical protein